MLIVFSFFVLIGSAFAPESIDTEQNEHLALIPESHTEEIDYTITRNPTHEALAVVVKKNSIIQHNSWLPYKAKEIEGEIEYPDPENPNETVEYLCPAEGVTQLLLQKHQQRFPQVEYCLLKHSNSSNRSKCEQEVKPLFTLIEDREDPTPKKCGKDFRHHLYTFGFMYCTVEDQGISELPKITSSLLGIYEVCFDTYRLKTLFTKHDVRTGAMLERPGFSSQRLHQPFVLSTQSFHIPDEENILSNIAQEYIEQDPKTRYKMIPQMLVPEKDIALKIWKQTTLHYLNTKPLWDELVPLMNAINDGIRKAAVTVDLRNEKNPEEDPSYHTLDIFTITFSHLSWPWRIYKNLISFFKRNNDQPFGLSIWCKFVYYPLQNTGVMIYLHNLPDSPPGKMNTKPNDPNSKDWLKEKECKKPVSCNFKMWADEPGSLSDELLEYAYCCEPDENKLKEYFSIILKEIKLLDIDEIVKENAF